MFALTHHTENQMPKFLFVQSSIRGAASVSGQLAASLKEQLDVIPGNEILERNLGGNPLPVLDGALLDALFAPADALDSVQKAQTALVTTLIDELKAADTVVLSAGMYNFGVPVQLKTWFDYVLQAGRTFRYTASGPEGLVKGKRAILLVATGSVYSKGPTATADFMVPHLKQLLSFIGITDVTVVRAEGLAFGPDAAKAGLEKAAAEIRTLKTA
ncbi:FMN-dependent NADH-azoreductase [Cupriavidus basilensis]|uniref:FMN-dependent NADH-azoreductase n=1 Tax=Cupriavidus basilensis TaxID=68895 RepID=UPI0023E8056C|nr:NAD(P)H-dependent oxidoreductase [Cupriavidus basilensis]MDF3889042.1 NAD(P)H-dependent oxidoreductase [Cupriavidus basilensis]